MKVYISGPMTGYPDFNHPAFEQAAQDLLAAGHEPLSPTAPPVVPGQPWADYMRADLRDLLDADGVALLNGWEASKGARLEVHVAHELGLRVLPIIRWTGLAVPDAPFQPTRAPGVQCGAALYSDLGTWYCSRDLGHLGDHYRVTAPGDGYWTDANSYPPPRSVTERTAAIRRGEAHA